MFQISDSELNAAAVRLAELRERVLAERDNVRSSNSNVTTDDDVRVSAFGRLFSVIDSALLGLILMGQHLGNSDWWDYTFEPDIPEASQRESTLSFSLSIKFLLLQGAFSVLESSFRWILRAIDPSACSGGTAPFQNIYQCLFNSKLSATPPDGESLFELLRLARNTIHNNGVHVHRRGTPTQTVVHKGATYSFEHDKPIDMVEWNKVIYYFEEAFEVLKHVVSDPAVAGISTPIEDPSAQSA